MGNTSATDISQLWRDIVEEVEERESLLAEEIGQTYDVAESLRRPLRLWEAGDKILRAEPVVRAYESHLGRELPQPLLRYLLGRDIYIDVWDDLIDTADLDSEDILTLTINADFADQLRLGSLPAAKEDALLDAELGYKTKLFNIPYHEQRKREQMEAASDEEELLKAAESFYRFRSRVIDGLAYPVRIWLDVDGKSADYLEQDLQVNSARRQLLKDNRDIERDLRDNDVKPPIVLMRRYSTPSQVADRIEHIYNSFEYSEQSRESGYRQELLELESAPEDMETLVAEQMETIQD